MKVHNLFAMAGVLFAVGILLSLAWVMLREAQRKARNASGWGWRTHTGLTVNGPDEYPLASAFAFVRRLSLTVHALAEMGERLDAWEADDFMRWIAGAHASLVVGGGVRMGSLVAADGIVVFVPDLADYRVDSAGVTHALVAAYLGGSPWSALHDEVVLAARHLADRLASGDPDAVTSPGVAA